VRPPPSKWALLSPRQPGIAHQLKTWSAGNPEIKKPDQQGLDRESGRQAPPAVCPALPGKPKRPPRSSPPLSGPRPHPRTYCNRCPAGISHRASARYRTWCIGLVREAHRRFGPHQRRAGSPITSLPRWQPPPCRSLRHLRGRQLTRRGPPGNGACGQLTARFPLNRPFANRPSRSATVVHILVGRGQSKVDHHLRAPAPAARTERLQPGKRHGPFQAPGMCLRARLTRCRASRASWSVTGGVSARAELPWE